MTDAGSATTRAVEKTVEIEAPLDVVWRAITEEREVANWFAPVAKVEPGEGGSYFLSWGAGMEGTARISVWEPNARLQVAEQHGDTEITVDYYLEATAGGHTRLRLVHSGFGADAKWDAYYDGTDAGWTYFLMHLKRHVEHFLGSTRVMLMKRVPLPAADGPWPRVLKRAGLAAATLLSPGDLVQLALGAQHHEAVVEAVKAPHVLAVRLPAHNDALLLLEVEPHGQPAHCGVYLSVYDLPADRVASLRTGVAALAAAIADQTTEEP